MGCVCDTDASWSLDMQELSSPDCQDVQRFIFGGVADQNIFDHIDSNQDGEIDGNELATAIEDYDENHTEAPSGRYTPINVHTDLQDLYFN